MISIVFKRLFLLVTLATLLVGCASTYRVPIPEQTRKHLDSTDMVFVFNQKELYADYAKTDSSSTGSQYGFLGSIVSLTVDSAMNSRSQKKAKDLFIPIKQSLGGVRYDKSLEKAITKRLARIDWLKLNKAGVTGVYGSKANAKAAEKSKNGALLVIRTNYYLRQQLVGFTVNSNVALYARNENLRKLAGKQSGGKSIIYRNSFYFTEPLPKDIKGGKLAAEYWSADGGKKIRTAMLKSIKSLSKRIAEDIQNPEIKK